MKKDTLARLKNQQITKITIAESVALSAHIFRIILSLLDIYPAHLS